MQLYTDEQLTYEIRGAIFEVHTQLGPGLLEDVYEEALMIELKSRGLKVQNQVLVPVYYKGQKLNKEYRLDILVNGRVIVELKSVEQLSKVHYKQLYNYLRLTNLRVGILVNFNSDTIDRTSFERIFNKHATDKCDNNLPY